MFPHTITIYHHTVDEGVDIYTKKEVPGWYVMQTIASVPAGKGAERSSSYKMVASPATTSQYGVYWDVYVGDRIVKGSGPDISSWKELKGAMVVNSIEVNMCGSAVDNITVTA